jgi:hypothetical protein
MDQSVGISYLPDYGILVLIKLFSNIPFVPYEELNKFGCIYR